MRNVLWNGLLAATIAATPVSASAQCPMMSGGGHEHGQANGHQHGQKAPEGVDKKAKRNAQKLLEDQKGRDALMEALLEDSEFTRMFLTRLSEDPEWRAMLRDALDAEPQGADAQGLREDSRTPTAKAQPADQPIYRCPMHHDVVSSRPGECPKCGMTLERVSDSSEE